MGGRTSKGRLEGSVAVVSLFIGVMFGFACGDDATTTGAGATDGGGGGDGSVVDGSPDVTVETGVEASSRMILDPSFGTGGKVVLAEGDADPARDIRGVVVQSSGQIVIGLADYGGPTATDLVRLTASGAHDGTFGEDGGVAATKLVFGQLVPSPNSDTLVVSGSPMDSPGACEIARYLAGGTLDPAYGTGGRATGGAGGGIPVVQADGKVLSGLSGGAIVNRLDTAGKLDDTFGDPAGYAIVKPITRYSFRALAPQADGKIVVAGDEHDDAGMDYGCLVLRLTSGGGVDPDFGAGGETFLGEGCQSVRGVTMTSDAKIVVRASNTGLSLHLVRLTSTGAVDPSYAPTSDVFDPHTNAVPLAGDRLTFLALATDQHTFGAWRIAANGGVDTTFAPAGVRPMDERWSRNAIIAMQPDGKMVVAGLLGTALVVARYLP